MARRKLVSDFPALTSEDNISLTISQGTNGAVVRFRLSAGNDVTWWKALEVYDVRGALIGSVQTQDDESGPNSFNVNANLLGGAKLVLAKAKMFGVHTPMYEIHNLSAFRGQVLRFDWNSDTHTDGPVAGFFRDITQTVFEGADATAQGVSDVTHTVGEVVGGFFESGGNGLKTLMGLAANLVETVPALGPYGKMFMEYVGNVGDAFYDSLGTIIKAIIENIGHIISGSIRVVVGGISGLLLWDASVFLKGLGDFTAIGGSILAVGGKSIALFQTILLPGIVPTPRELTGTEIANLTLVYRGSINLSKVRVIDGLVGILSLPELFTQNPRPFCLGNKVYMKNNVSGTALYNSILIHECGHVWQNQHEGFRYISDALGGQIIYGDAYDWEAEIARGNTSWIDFNKEAKAELLQSVWDGGVLIPTTSTVGEFYTSDPVASNVSFFGPVTGGDFTGFAQDSIAVLRSKRALPI